MAAVRAIMQAVEDVHPGPDADTFVWRIRWACFSTAGDGRAASLSTATVIQAGDTAAQTTAKIIDSIVAVVAAAGHTVQRTSVYLIDYVRGS